MSNKTFKACFYTVLTLLILIFYTKDINLFGNNYYKNIKTITEPDIYLVLVNKEYKLPENYVPSKLELISNEFANENKYLREEARIAFETLSKNAKELGYRIIAVSTYRDYEYQNKLYNMYVEEKGLDYADKCSARPGHSEHQTGLAVDVEGSNHDYDEFENSKEFIWMKENAYKYGFILRYPKGKEKITGFKYEPWHYRYVGLDTAKTIHDENLSLEEYYDKYINLN